MNQELSTTEAKQMRPIIFSTPMVKAILEGRKTQTRRIMKPQPGFYVGQIIKPGDEQFFHSVEKDGWRPSNVWKLSELSGTNGGCLTVSYKCPYGKVGDILYVRETWRRYFHVDEHGYTKFDQEIIEFAADNPPMIYQMDGDGCIETNKDGSEKFIPWKPCIHMPKKIARIFLKITGISVERLQDITEEDAKAEGVEWRIMGKEYGRLAGERLYKDYLNPSNTEFGPTFAKDSFNYLWQAINGLESWDTNPWVWKITFAIIDKPKEP